MTRHLFNFASAVSLLLCLLMIALWLLGQFRLDRWEYMYCVPSVQALRTVRVQSGTGWIIIARTDFISPEIIPVDGQLAHQKFPLRVNVAPSASNQWAYANDYPARPVLRGQVAYREAGARSILLIASFAVLPAWWLCRRWSRRVQPGCCVHCGYDLRASPDRCPECGAAIDWATREKPPMKPAATPNFPNRRSKHASPP